MSAHLSKTIADARSFLSQLGANNTRDWFQDHKKEYERAIKIPGNTMGMEMASRLMPLTGKEMNHKLFRINRDIRFSKDKTPYNTHLHLLWSDGTGAGFFFGVSPEYVTAGAGVMGLAKEQLVTYRAQVDQDGNALSKQIKSLTDQGYRLDPPDLKRVPAPYPKEHAHAELLKRKSLALWSDLNPDHLTLDDLLASFETLLPIYQFCETLK